MAGIPLDNAAMGSEGADDQMTGEASTQEPVDQKDLELVTRMGIKMLSGNGLQVIQKALQSSKDPAMVIGQFLSQIMMVLVQKLHEEVGLDPRVFLAKNGWLDAMLDYIETKLKLPSDFSDQVYGQVLETLKAAAQNGSAQPPQDGPPQGAPPQGGPPQPGPGGM